MLWYKVKKFFLSHITKKTACEFLDDGSKTYEIIDAGTLQVSVTECFVIDKIDHF